MKTPIAIVLFAALLQATPSFSQELRKPIVVSIQKMKGFSKELSRKVIADSINARLGKDLPVLFTSGGEAEEADFVVEIYSNWLIWRDLKTHSYGNSTLVYSGTTGSRDVDMGFSGWTQDPQYSTPITYRYTTNEEGPAEGSFRVLIFDQLHDRRKLGEYMIDVQGTTYTIDRKSIDSISDSLISFFCFF